jgi:hypothetical protein
VIPFQSVEDCLNREVEGDCAILDVALPGSSASI